MLSSFQIELKSPEYGSQEKAREGYNDFYYLCFEYLERDIEFNAGSDRRYDDLKRFMDIVGLWDQESIETPDFRRFEGLLSEEARQLLQDRYGITEASFKSFHSEQMNVRYFRQVGIRNRAEQEAREQRREADFTARMREKAKIYMRLQEVYMELGQIRARLAEHRAWYAENGITPPNAV